jgi:hypothetical protein
MILCLVSFLPSMVSADTSGLPTTGSKLSGGFFPAGDAYLKVKNAPDYQAVFIMTKSGSMKPVVSYFFRKGESYTVPDIPIGSYNFYFELGSDWNSTSKQFNDGMLAMFADRSGTNPETVTYDSMTAGYEITLYGVVEGNANTKKIDRDSFPKI